MANFSPTISAGLVAAALADAPAPLASNIALDSFTRVDAATLGTTESGSKTWSSDIGTWGIVGNTAKPSATTANLAVATIDAGTRDVYIEAQITWTGAGSASLLLAGTDAQNFLSIRCSNTLPTSYSCSVALTTAGTLAILSTGATVTANAPTLTIGARIKGRLVEVTVNGLYYTRHILTQAQSDALTGTRVGLTAQILTVSFDNVKVKTAELINEMNYGSVVDASGSGTIIAQTDPAQWPRWSKENGIPYFTKGAATGSGFTFTFAEPLNYSNLTVFVVGRNTGDVTAKQFIMTAPEGAQAGLMLLNSDFMVGRSGFNYSALTTQNSVDTIMWMSGSSTGFPEIGPGVWMGLDGRETFRTQDGNQTTYAAGAFTTMFLGGINGGQGASAWQGKWRAVFVYNRSFTIEQARAMQAELGLYFGVRINEVTQEYFAVGDSITSGAVGQAAARTYFDRVVAAQTEPTRAYNFGISNQTMAQIKATLATKILPTMKRSKAKKRFCTLFAGTNDLSVANALPTLLTDAKEVSSTLLATGIPLIFLPTLPRGTTTQFATDRTAYNAAMRLETSRYTALADVAANATIGVEGAQNNLTYYQSDKTHPTTDGHTIIATEVLAAQATVPVETVDPALVEAIRLKLERTDGLLANTKTSADSAARPNQVSPTIDFNPTINPPAVNVDVQPFVDAIEALPVPPSKEDIADRVTTELLTRPNTIAPGFNVKDSLHITAAVAAAKTVDSTTDNPKIRDLADTTDLITATIDEEGNRETVFDLS